MHRSLRCPTRGSGCSTRVHGRPAGLSVDVDDEARVRRTVERARDMGRGACGEARDDGIVLGIVQAIISVAGIVECAAVLPRSMARPPLELITFRG